MRRLPPPKAVATNNSLRDNAFKSHRLDEKRGKTR